MSLLEIGGLASATVAVITLISKLVNLITAIQSLILRIDEMQRLSPYNCVKRKSQVISGTM